MRFILLLSCIFLLFLILIVLVFLCNATDGVSNLRRRLEEVPNYVILKFTLKDSKEDVYIKGGDIVKKKGEEFTYFQATIDKTDSKSKYTSTAQFECTGTGEGKQTLNDCTKTGVSCSDSLATFTINYSSGGGGGGDEEIESNTPPEEKKDKSERELSSTAIATFDGTDPSDSNGISIVTDDTENIFTTYTNSANCKTGSDEPKPIPPNTVIKFVLKNEGTVYLSDNKGLKIKENAYSYYTIVKTNDSAKTQSKYTLTPVYVCDGLNQGNSLTTCTKDNEAKCTKIEYVIKYIAKKPAFVNTPTGLEGGTLAESTESEAKFGSYDAEGDCPTGSETTRPVPDDKVLKFVLKKDNVEETVYLSKEKGLKKKVGEYEYSYYTIVKDDETDKTQSKYTLTPKYICDGKKQSTSLNTCKDPREGDCISITFIVKYTATTLPKAEFVEIIEGLQGAIIILNDESEVNFEKYSNPDYCPTSGGSDGEIKADDLSAIPKNAIVKSTEDKDGDYNFFTDNVYYYITSTLQLSIPITKSNGEKNSTYTINKDADFIEKTTGIKMKDSESIPQEYNCIGTDKKFLSLKWLKDNCNKTKIDEVMEDMLQSKKSDKTYILGVNASVVYSYDNEHFSKFGEIVKSLDIMEDKSWFVYPSLLLSIIFIIIF